MVKRALVIVTAFTVLLVGLFVPEATANTRSSITITSQVRPFPSPILTRTPPSPPTAMPGEVVGLSGSVTRSVGRVVVLQRLAAGAWHEVARRSVSATSWRFATTAKAPGRYTYRALALRTRTAGGATSATRVVTVVRPTVSISAAATVGTGRLVTFAGAADPARPRHRVQLWQLRGPRWVVIADSEQSSTGTFTFGQLAAPLGRHTYRAVTEAGDGHFDVRSPSRDVTTVRASRTGARSAYLAGVTPAGLLSADTYRVQPVTVAGHAYAMSIASVADRLTWQLGTGAQSLATAVTLRPFRAADPLLPFYDGPRLVEVRVDGALRLRRFFRPGQVVPLTLDLRGKHTLTLASFDRGPLDLDFGSGVVLVDPVVSTVPRTERAVDTGTALSELPAVARTGPVQSNQVLGSAASRLYGGSLELDSTPSSTTLTSAVDYDLGAAYTSLTGVPWITLEAAEGVTTGRVRLYGDGVLIATLEGRFDRRRATVDVTGVRRLRVELVADPPDNWFYTWAVAFADPRLA